MLSKALVEFLKFFDRELFESQIYCRFYEFAANFVLRTKCIVSETTKLESKGTNKQIIYLDALCILVRITFGRDIITSLSSG